MIWLRRLANMSGTPLFAATAVSQVAVFVRNVIIVRTLTKTDYGIAATFLFSMTIVQASVNLNIGKLLIQAPDGEDVRFQRCAHLTQFLQGAASSAILYLAAPLMAQLFNAPQALDAYRMLAIAPLFVGFLHFDTSRYERSSRFGAIAMVSAGGEVFSLIVVIVLAPLISDYNLVAFSLIAVAGSSTIISILLAERSYRWAVDRSFMRRIVRYGWPLLLNSIFMVLIAQGDRALLGSSETLSALSQKWLGEAWASVGAFEKADLAIYSIGLALVLMPTQFIAQTLATLLFPMMTRVHREPELFEDVYSSSVVVFSVAATLIAVGFILAGGPVVALIYSESYRGVEVVIGLLALAQALRVMRLPVVTASLAVAYTRMPLYANIARAVALASTAVVVLYHLGLEWVALTAAAGEALSLGIALVIARGRFGLRLQAVAGPFAFSALAFGAAFAANRVLAPLADPIRMGGAAAFGLALLLVACVVFPRFLPGLRELLAARQQREVDARENGAGPTE